MSKYTKIVATISDARCDVDFIKQLYESGMNVVRMNSAHLQEEGFQKIIDNVRAVSNKIACLLYTSSVLFLFIFALNINRNRSILFLNS